MITGKSVPKCYANFLNDCGGSISREHPFPKCGLVELFGTDPIDISGWGTNKDMSLPASAAYSNILCQRHNNLLGHVDGAMKTWIQCINIMQEGLQHNQPHRSIDSREMCLILLQLSCGTMAINKKSIPNRWVEILFSRSNYTFELYQLGRPGRPLPYPIKVSHQVLDDRNGKLIGCTLQIRGFSLATFIDYNPKNNSYFNDWIKAKKIHRTPFFQVNFT